MEQEIIEILRTNEAYPSWQDTYDAEGNRVRPTIRCQCGEYTNIDNHYIHPDGRIMASYFHKDGCGWHVYLKMLDWDGGEMFPWQDKCNQNGT